MKRLIIMLAGIVLTLLSATAQEKVPAVTTLEYYQTDKKGNRTLSYTLDYNDRFDIYVVHIDRPSLKGSVVLTDEAKKELIRLSKDLTLMEEKNVREKLDSDDEDSIWDFKLMLKEKDYSSLFDSGKLSTMEKVMKGGESDKKRLFEKFGRLANFLDNQLKDYQSLHPTPVVVYFYDSEGANGLAGILRDGQGKEVDQTTDFAYVDTKEGAKVYSYHFEKTQVFDVAQPQVMQEEIVKKVKVVKYVKPEFDVFVTDAAPPKYSIAMSDGKRMSTSDDNDYKYRPKEMPSQRYDVKNHYEIFTIADKHTGYQKAIENNYEERMEKGKARTKKNIRR